MAGRPKPIRPTKSTTVELYIDQLKPLRQIALDKDTTVSAMMREMADEMIKGSEQDK